MGRPGGYLDAEILRLKPKGLIMEDTESTEEKLDLFF